MITTRIICDIFLIGSVFLLPWWLAFFLSLIFLFVFDFYWEMTIACIVLDVLYSFGAHLSIQSLKFFLISIVILAVSLPLKNRLKFYSLKR
jgi:hypothetical protein